MDYAGVCRLPGNGATVAAVGPSYRVRQSDAASSTRCRCFYFPPIKSVQHGGEPIRRGYFHLKFLFNH